MTAGSLPAIPLFVKYSDPNLPQCVSHINRLLEHAGTYFSKELDSNFLSNSTNSRTMAHLVSIGRSRQTS